MLVLCATLLSSQNNRRRDAEHEGYPQENLLGKCVYDSMYVVQVHTHGLDLDFLAFGLALALTVLLILGTHETSLFNLGTPDSAMGTTQAVSFSRAQSV